MQMPMQMSVHMPIHKVNGCHKEITGLKLQISTLQGDAKKTKAKIEQQTELIHSQIKSMERQQGKIDSLKETLEELGEEDEIESTRP